MDYESASNVSTYIGIALKAVLTIFLGVISYAFNDIQAKLDKAVTATADHATHIAVLQNNYVAIDKKLDRLLDQVERR